jgi:tetratricopeptide (TPR) repeat protein
MALLLSRWERTREAQGQLALVIGEPGIGKSRLVEEFRAAIRDDPHLWVECAGEPLFQSTPFHAVTQILDQGLEWRGDESPEERVAQLELRLERAGLKVGEALPLIAEMLSLPIPDKYPQLVFAPEQRRKRLLANLAGWVLNGSRLRPMVMAMEDLHWIDPSTLELTQTLVEQAATAPLMLLCTARPEFRAPWPSRAHHAQLTLNRLNARQTREMVSGVVARTALAQDLIDAVVIRTDGVPLFAEELTRLILEGDGRSVVREIPATLHDSLTARLDRLGPAKEVAQLAAVIGREFSYELLHAVAPICDSELQSALEKLIDAELIYARGIAPEATYQFKHALIQDAAYEALLKTRRKELHHRVAQTITEKFAAVAEVRPEVVARHWTQAGEAEPAVASWKKAGEVADARQAFKEAGEDYRRALAMLNTLPETQQRDERELELASALARVMQLTTGYSTPETREAAAHARTVAEKTGNLAGLVMHGVGTWATVYVSGDFQRAAAVADEVIDLARREGSDTSLGFAHIAQVITRFGPGDMVGVEEHFARFGRFAKASGLNQIPGTVLNAVCTGCLSAWILGYPDKARKRLADAMAFAQASNDPYEIAYAQFYESWLFRFLREPQRAEVAGIPALAMAEEHDFSYLKHIASCVLAWARAQLGQDDGTISLIQQHVSGLVESGSRVSITELMTQLAETQASGGLIDGAVRTLEDALQRYPGEIVYKPSILTRRGEMRLTLGQADLAEHDLREAIELSRKMRAKTWELRAAMSLARMIQARASRGAARDLLFPIFSWFIEGFDTADLKDAKALLDDLSNSP